MGIGVVISVLVVVDGAMLDSWARECFFLSLSYGHVIFLRQPAGKLSQTAVKTSQLRLQDGRNSGLNAPTHAVESAYATQSPSIF